MKKKKNISELTEDNLQPLCGEDSQTSPEQEADTNKKEKKPRKTHKEKKQERKQLRKDLRRQKKEAYRSKTLIGKIFYNLGKLIQLLVIALMLVTIVRVNYKEAGAVLKFAGAVVQHLVQGGDGGEVTQEQIYEMAPLDEERGAVIDASKPIGKGETWAIYMYIVGSDLEASYNDQLSDAVYVLAQREAIQLRQERKDRSINDMADMVDTILANDLNLPNSMYAKSISSNMIKTASNEMDQQMMQMLGDYHAASTDIQEIMEVTLPENVQVVLQTGGATAWGNSMINPNKTQRFLYDANGMKQVYDGHISNMGDPNTLVDFLTYCEEEYPADHTMVVFWNHGSGAFGYGVDSIYLNDLLSLEEMRWAFEQVYTPDEENPPLDIIGFDACLMASMEVANTLHGFAGYMLGSEDVEPGDGWDYTSWLGSLAENPRMNARQLGKAVTDSYVDYYSKRAVPSGAGSQLFSMIDLSYADDLYQAYSGFAEAALAESVDYAGTAAALGKAANSSIKYAGNHMDVYNTLDLGLFMQSVGGNLKSESQKVLDVLDDMVLYSRACNTVTDSTGITVYYPATVSDFYGLIYATDYINQVCTDPSIQALYYYKVAGCLSEELQQHVSDLGYGEIKPMNVKPLLRMVDADFSLEQDGSFVMDFDEDARSITQEYRYNVMQVQEDGTVLRLGCDDYLIVNEAGDLVSDYDGKWAMIDGQLLPTQIVSSDGDTMRYRAPILYNGNDANLLLSYDHETGINSILGVQLLKSNADENNPYDVLTDRLTQELKPGDTITPVYEKYNMDTGVGSRQHGQSIHYDEDIRIVDEKLPNGSYMSYVTLIDARGDQYDMKLVSFDVNGGVISNAQLLDKH